MHHLRRIGRISAVSVAAAILAPVTASPARAQEKAVVSPSPVAPEISLSANDVVLPPGYVIEPVLTGMTYPNSLCWGDDGALYIAEAGYCYGQFWTESARIFRYRPDTGRVTTVAAGFRAPVMGLTFREGKLYVAHRGMISTVDLRSRGRGGLHPVSDIVTGLPVVPNGQHFNGPVAFSPVDGKMYYPVGTITNTGVPDASDGIYGWLLDLPSLRDAPARPITLTGETYPSPDVVGPTTDFLRIVRGSAFQPFGTPAKAGQTVPAHPLPTGAIFRSNPDGTGRELVAWGIRSPVGFAFGPDRQLYLTDHGVDDKGARAVADAPDALWRVRDGAWYGWPDFTGGLPVTDRRFLPEFPLSPPPKFVMTEHPPVEQPAARFEPHVSAMKFDWSRSERFGYPGEMFLAEFGDGQPVTTGLQKIERQGFRVVRVNTQTGSVEPFLSIRDPGTAKTRGPKRPFAVQFDPSGENLYLLDFGVLAINVSLRDVGIDAPIRTGTLWRIRRQNATAATTAALAAASPAPLPLALAEGSRYASWWSSRGPVLVMQRDLRAALAHARHARNTALSDLPRQQHADKARDLLRGVATLAAFTLKRIDDSDTFDDGTHFFLLQLRDRAESAEPTTLTDDAAIIRDVAQWVERTEFPDSDYLRANYGAPGLWQRPLERDIRP
jgi:glucose/arabinose dehydrogenase